MHPLNGLQPPPVASGRIKSQPADFIVIEDLGFPPDGDGDHLLVRLRKQGMNSQFVAQALARFCQIPLRDLSMAGQKDRHALAEQWFCLRLPGKTVPDFNAFNLPGCQILDVARHRRKLRPGFLRGNHFQITVRNISQPDEVATRLPILAQQGALNYFGAQRFGRHASNLRQAYLWAQTGKPPRDRLQRGFALSAARSLLFNQIVSQRQKVSEFNQIMPGDALQLAGRGSWFVAQARELAELQTRVDQGELLITAPLPGAGAPGTAHQALAFEQQCLAKESGLLALLEKEKLAPARRAIRLLPQDFYWRWQSQHCLILRFWLPAGSFATSVLQELVNLTDDDASFTQ